MDERMTPAPDAPPAAPAAPGERRAGTPRRFAGWYRRHVWPATAALILLVFAAGFVTLQLVVRDRIGDGVTVAGLEMQGRSAASARETLARDLVPRVSAVQLQTGAHEPLTLTLAQLGMSVDVTATAQAALARGRHRLALGLQVWLPGGGGDVTPTVRVNAAAYQQGLEAVGAAVDVAARDARLDISAGGDGVTVVPSRDGTTADAVALERAIEASVVRGKVYAGPVPMKAVPPQVSTADAEARAGVAAMYLARPVTLRYRERTVVLSPREMAGMLSVNIGADAATYPLTFRNERAAARLHELFSWAETPPVDARIEVHPEGGITVTPSKVGEVLDMKVLLEDLDDTALGGGLRSVFVALKPALPELTSDDVETMGLAALGAQFVTYFDPRNTTRAGNIALAAKLVDGSVVEPGQTFSLNAAMGPRTTNRGFDYAPVIAADGVLRQGVGGGICQYATTLFNAVLLAGLPIVEREAHSLYISHYPIGRDATVSWGAVDFKFKNYAGKALLIRSALPVSFLNLK